MSWWKASSLEGRLIRLILLASTLALLCVMVGVVVYESTSFQPRALAQLRQPADILKELLQPALDFDAREDVDRYLKKYCEGQANPLVAVVYDDKGRVFASYPPSLAAAPNSPAPSGYNFSSGALAIWEQLERQQQVLGHLYLREQLPPLYVRLAQYSLMLATLLTALIIVGGTLLFGARRNILYPIAGLVKTTEHVIQYNDFSVRSDLQQDDEVGHLARTFNRMLDVISASDASLRQSEANLAADLTQRKLAEAKLIQSEQRYRALFENMSSGFVLFEVVQDEQGIPEDLIILAANQGFEAATGLKQVEFRGKRLIQVLTGIETDKADWIGTFGQVALTGEQQQFEQGSELLGYFYSVTAYQAGPKQCAVIFTDITDRKLAEAALQSHREQLQQLNQELEMRVGQRTAELEASNQELEAFNYSVSHDLRAPLRHVAGFIELLKRQGYANADQKSLHYMAVISESAVQMGNMVDDILTFSRLGRTEMRMTHVNLDGLVKAALSILQPEIKGREIRWIISPLPSVEGEREMLQRVMTNLIGNALKYSRPRAVTVIEVSSQTQGDENIYCVKDNGVGFDMRYVDKLFGVFQRLHRADEFEGTGIGLANVQRIIQRHGGRVWAEAKVDEGASFYFSLPML